MPVNIQVGIHIIIILINMIIIIIINMMIMIIFIVILIMITTVQVYAGNSKGRSDTLVIAENISLREDTTKVMMIINHDSIIILIHNHDINDDLTISTAGNRVTS